MSSFCDSRIAIYIRCCHCSDFHMTSVQLDICRFRAVTLSPLQQLLNWSVFTVYKITQSQNWIKKICSEKHSKHIRPLNWNIVVCKSITVLKCTWSKSDHMRRTYRGKRFQHFGLRGPDLDQNVVGGINSVVARPLAARCGCQICRPYQDNSTI